MKRTMKSIASLTMSVLLAAVIIAGCSGGGETGGPATAERPVITLDNAAEGIVLEVNTGTGEYTVTRNGRVWIGKGIVAMRPDAEMLVNVDASGGFTGQMEITGSAETGEGEDNLGSYKSLFIPWKAGGMVFDTGFLVYQDSPDIRFVLRFPNGYESEKVFARKDTGLNFPVFVADDSGDELNVFSYTYDTWPNPQFGKGVKKTLETWGAPKVCTPLLIFDAEGNTGVMSTINNYLSRFARVMDLTAQGLGFGVGVGYNGELKVLPEGRLSETLLHFHDGGITAAMNSWGARLLKETGKNPVDKDETLFLKYIGYWTDNGGYYYYRKEPGKNYETTLLEFKDYIDEENIPFKYVQLDSWWYPKSEKDGGVMLWEPLESMFPDGLVSFQQKLGLPMTFHNRYYAIDTPYQERYKFVKGTEGVHPLDKGIFDEFGDNVKKWGGVMYEQDWLNKQTDRVEALRNDPRIAEQWMKNMADSMSERDLEIQYCMPQMDFYLLSSNYQNVTNIRSANDYRIRANGRSNQLWWEHVYTSPVIYALGALPFKDVIITNPPDIKLSTTTQKQYYWSDGEYKGEGANLFEPFYHESALLSVLSAGPIGVGDRINAVNKEIVMLMAAEDGDIVKPDLPLVPVDRMYYGDPKIDNEIMVGYTLSEVSGLTWYYVLGMNVNEAMSTLKFKLKQGDLGFAGKYLLYDFLNGRAKVVDESLDMELKLKGLESIYIVMAPMTENGRALIGDAGKYVTASKDRIKSASDTAEAMEVELAGPAGSPTEILVYSETAPTAVTVGDKNVDKAKSAEDINGGAGLWGQTGKNLYTVSIPGGDGVNVKIEF